MPEASERRALVGQLVSEGHKSSSSVAKTLKDEHGIDVHRSTVARDMERLHAESSPKGGTERDAMIERYDARVRDLSEMLKDKDLSKREKLAVHRTLNETEGKLVALREKIQEDNDANPQETEEARLKHNARRLRWLEEMAAKHQRETKIQLRAEIYKELREKGVEIDF